MTEDHSERDNGLRQATDEPKVAAPGWLASLRATLGLSEPPSLRDTLKEALEQADQPDSFSTGEREILLRLLRFGSSRVEDIMVPRADIIAIDENAPVAKLLATFEAAGVSRVPVYAETLDDPRGMIHIKDLFRWVMAEAGSCHVAAMENGNGGSQFALNPNQLHRALAKLDLTKPIAAAKIRRPMLFVPPSMRAMDLLVKMQSSRIHMALVVDEYGGTDGLLTIEDLVEQVVGNIEDEHDEDEEALIVRDTGDGLTVSARTPVSELDALLGLRLLGPEQEATIDTVGGLVFSIVGRVPAEGERVVHDTGVTFEIIEADQRRVKSLRVYPLDSVLPFDGNRSGIATA